MLWSVLVTIGCTTAAKFLRSSGATRRQRNDGPNSNDHEATHVTHHARHLFDDTQPIAVALHSFRLNIGPTAQPLEQFQIDEVQDTIENLLFEKLTNDAAYASLNQVENIELTGQPEVVHIPALEINDFMTRMAMSTLDYTSGGVAKFSYSSIGDIPSAKEISDATQEILQRHLKSSLKQMVDGLEWLTMVDVEMDGPPTASPTVQPTATPTKSPTLSPTESPSKSPTGSPTRIPTAGPTTTPTTAPTFGPTSSPTPLPTSSPTPSPTPSPTAVVFERDPTSSPTPLPTAAPQKITPMPTEESNNTLNQGTEVIEEDIPSDSSDFTLIIGGICAAVGILVGAALYSRRKRRERRYTLALGDRDGSKGDELGFVEDRFCDEHGGGDGDSTQTPDTAEGKMLANDMLTPSQSQSPLGITSLRESAAVHKTPPKSDNANGITLFGMKDNSPGLYFPIYLGDQEGEGEDVHHEMPRFDDHPVDSMGEDSEVSLPQNKCRDQQSKEATNFSSVITPMQNTLGGSEGKGATNPLKPSDSPLLALADIEEEESQAESPLDNVNADEIEDVILEEGEIDCEQNSDSDSEEDDESERATIGEVYNKEDHEEIQDQVPNSDQVERPENGEVAEDEDDGQFVMDTSWDPNDTDDAISFDEPQFEPTFINESMSMATLMPVTQITDANQDDVLSFGAPFESQDAAQIHDAIQDDGLSFGATSFDPQDGFQYDDFVTDAEQHSFS